MSTRQLKYYLFVFISILLFFNYGCEKAENNGKTFKIGVIAPFTGDLSIYANNARNGMLLAQEEINTTGYLKNGMNLKLIVEDTMLSSKYAINAVNKLINIDKVRVIIGDITSSATLSVAPIAEKNKVVLLANGGSAPKIRYAGDYIFRIWNSDDFEAKLMAKYLKDSMNVNDVSIIYTPDDYCIGLMNAFKNVFENENKKIVNILEYNSSTRNFRNIISKIFNSVKHLYILGYPKELGILVRQLRESRKDIVLLGSSTLDTQEFINIAGKDNCEGTILTSQFFDLSLTEKSRKFANNYLKKFKSEPDIFATVSYDAVYIIAEAINNVNDFPELKNEMYKIKNFQGVSGEISFDSYGDVSKPLVFKKIKNGIFLNLFIAK